MQLWFYFETERNCEAFHKQNENYQRQEIYSQEMYALWLLLKNTRRYILEKNQ